MLRAVLINPEMRTITEAQTRGRLDDIHALVQDKDGLDSFRLAEYETSWDYGWADDMGLANGAPIHAFKFDIRPDPIAGRCLIIGLDEQSRDECDALVSVDFLRKHITWLGLIKPEVTWVEEANGARAVVTYERVG